MRCFIMITNKKIKYLGQLNHFSLTSENNYIIRKIMRKYTLEAYNFYDSAQLNDCDYTKCIDEINTYFATIPNINDNKKHRKVK